MFGATQWGCAAIRFHSQLDDMEVITSNTPIHTFENSCCYKSEFSTEKIINALSGVKSLSTGSEIQLDPKDLKSQLKLQMRIEQGEKFYINGRPTQKT